MGIFKDLWFAGYPVEDWLFFGFWGLAFLAVAVLLPLMWFVALVKRWWVVVRNPNNP